MSQKFAQPNCLPAPTGPLNRRVRLGMMALLVATVLGLCAFATPANADPASVPTTTPPTTAAPTTTTTTTAPGADPNATSALQGTIGAADGLAAPSVLKAISFFGMGSSPVISRQAWFTDQWGVLTQMGIWVLLPLVLISIMHSVVKGSMAQLLRTMLVFLPIAIIGTVVAVQVVQLLLDITDDFSASFLSSLSGNYTSYFNNILNGFSDPSVAGAAAKSGGAILGAIVAILLFFAGVAVYLVLVIREASVYIATAFLPIGFAMLVWPSTSKLCRKLVEFLAGMIFSKLVMVAGLSLALASVAGTPGAAGNTAPSMYLGSSQAQLASSSTPVDGASSNFFVWLAAAIFTVAVLATMAFAPKVVMGIFAMAAEEIAAGLNHLVHKSGHVTNVILGFDRGRQIKGGFRQVRANIATNLANQTPRTDTSEEEEQLRRMGVVPKRDASGGTDYSVTDDELFRAGITDKAQRDILLALSKTNDPNFLAYVYAAKAMGSDYDGSISTRSTNGLMIAGKADSNGNREGVFIPDVVDPVTGQAISWQDPRATSMAVESALASGQVTSVRILTTANANTENGRRELSGLVTAVGNNHRVAIVNVNVKPFNDSGAAFLRTVPGVTVANNIEGAVAQKTFSQL